MVAPPSRARRPRSLAAPASSATHLSTTWAESAAPLHYQCAVHLNDHMVSKNSKLYNFERFFDFLTNTIERQKRLISENQDQVHLLCRPTFVLTLVNTCVTNQLTNLELLHFKSNESLRSNIIFHFFFKTKTVFSPGYANYGRFGRASICSWFRYGAME